MVQQNLQKENFYLKDKVKKYEIVKEAVGQTVSDANVGRESRNEGGRVGIGKEERTEEWRKGGRIDNKY